MGKVIYLFTHAGVFLMSVAKPEPGMTYDFEVEGIFSFNDSVTFVGYPSVDYRQLIPAKAQVMVENSVYANIYITSYRIAGLSDKRSIVTYDKFDIEQIKDKESDPSLHLH